MSRFETLVRTCIDRCFAYFGYVPYARWQEQKEARQIAEHTLEMQSRDLAHQAGYRNFLERDVEFMRTLELHRVEADCARALSESTLHHATSKLDNCVLTLVQLMQNEWPHAVIHNPAEPKEAPPVAVGAA